MNRETDHCREYRNGNLTVKYSPDDIQLALFGTLYPFNHFLGIVDEIDCYLIDVKSGRYESLFILYNAHSDVCYRFSHSDITDILMEGKTLRLRAVKPDETMREQIEKWRAQ